MPSRAAIAVILLFWLGTAAWYVSREVVPYWGLEETPPYHIDLTDELRRLSTTKWQILVDDRLSGNATTTVHRRDDGRGFEITSEQNFQHGPLEVPHPLKDQMDLKIRKIISQYLVTREGELLEMKFKAYLLVNIPNNLLVWLLPSGEHLIELKGANEDGKLRPLLFFNGQEITFARAVEFSLPPNGKVLNPMATLNRIPGLQEGKRWREPMINPAGDMAGWVGKNVVPREVFAHVTTVTREWNEEETDCFLIEYWERPGNQGTLKARTWIRRRDSLVLRQEAYEGGQQIALVRVLDPS